MKNKITKTKCLKHLVLGHVIKNILGKKCAKFS